MTVYYSLYGQLLDINNLYKGFKQVKAAKGAAGIDRQSIAAFALNLEENLKQLQGELQSKQYRAQPVKRIEIPKDDGGVRLLGIPTVRDRIVQQTLLNILQPLFDIDFHPSSYGYRPKRSCHDAISKATVFIRKYHREWVVDMDLSKCFDLLDHDLIISSVKRKVTDGSILKLLKQFLKSGVMIGNNWEASELGSPQGGVISPLLANIYLDAFDQEMKKRNHRIVRYADDILILCCTEKAAKNALTVATQILEKGLKLTVNEKKTHIAHSSEGVKFLGVEIGSNWTRIQATKLKGFKQRVKRLTKRNSGMNLIEVIKRLNPVVRGFVNYFSIANCKRVLNLLARWVRRRLRAIQLRLWKNPARLHKRLKQLGKKPPFKFIKMNSWRNSLSPLSNVAMPNQWFEEQGLYSMEKVSTGWLAQSAFRK
ncbi:group II intron reverse transcriptase/maturase [Pseudoalteromonas sp. HL-AS2]|uniref:group II intron reverse transcriptase/maturase n=1 Tax=Pseudoalteromonas sp. HL-AS2 TaxID=3071082 RepID=UPI002814EB64|nr:group II intron reverse transcriptase/maturase [Pseudoalteromonas sp. HL-AS2]WMS94188.1 group II intron reverse transcriptase/maturase [Pseudoalteromonas sp. HL-AS2]